MIDMNVGFPNNAEVTLVHYLEIKERHAGLLKKSVLEFLLGKYWGKK